MKNKVDIKENYIREIDQSLLALLLLDKTTNKNIFWATDNYKSHGFGYNASDRITILSISGRYGSVLKPRTEKSKEEIRKRIRDKAEVFTPSWMCNSQNNLVDESWFGYKDVFNKEKDKSWEATQNKITFPNGKTWQDYVKANRLEITCGEAPYIVSRYDTVTGQIISLSERIGILDRKIRIVNENANSNEEWLEWVIWAFKSVYAYDWQGDNVVLARENLLFSFIDYYTERFNEMPSKDRLLEIASIIVWNVWQMDGLKCVIPNSCINIEEATYNLFGEEEQSKQICDGCKKNNIKRHNGIYCKIKDWEKNRTIKFVNLITKR